MVVRLGCSSVMVAPAVTVRMRRRLAAGAGGDAGMPECSSVTRGRG